MHTLPTTTSMKKRIYAISIGMALGLASVGDSRAMSTLIDLSFAPEWPATSNPGTVIVYNVTAVAREGSGMLDVSLSSLGLPEGAIVSFSPSVLRFVGHELTNQTSVMTITCPTVMPTDSYPFTITGTARRESITITNRFVQPLYAPIYGPLALAVDRLSGNSLRLRGKGSTGHLGVFCFYKVLPVPNGGVLALNGPATFSITDPLGRNVRYDPQAGDYVSDIPGCLTDRSPIGDPEDSTAITPPTDRIELPFPLDQ